MGDDLKWNFYIEKIFDDKLLDGNIVDILFVVDVIWLKVWFLMIYNGKDMWFL